MHMAIAHRLITDPDVPADVRDAAQIHWGAFLLGNVAPDARVSSGLKRTDTHFFDYAAVIDPPAAVAMLTKHPTLRYKATTDAAQAAFVAGYVAHLRVDEVWCTDALYPLFHDWGTRQSRFEMLHMLLGYLDARDYQTLPPSDYAPLHEATPSAWLPFIPDADLVTWRDLIANQLAPDGHNMTCNILAPRFGMTPDQMAAFISDPVCMDAQLWANVPPPRINDVEQRLYAGARQALIDYYRDVR
jgi:hypothetical protein